MRQLMLLTAALVMLGVLAAVTPAAAAPVGKEFVPSSGAQIVLASFGHSRHGSHFVTQRHYRSHGTPLVFQRYHHARPYYYHSRPQYFGHGTRYYLGPRYYGGFRPQYYYSPRGYLGYGRVFCR